MLAPKGAWGDLSIVGYEDRLHDPYYVGTDKDFIGQAYNWSGIGRISDPNGGTTNWKSLTMISENYFITADHNQPYRGNDPAGPAPKVRFYRTTDPNGEFWESEIATTGAKYVGERIGSTDLWVGKLSSTPPDWVMRYPLAMRHQAANYLSYTDNDLFIVGQDSPRSFTSLRVGRNEIDSVDIGGNYEWDYDLTDGLGADEAETMGGDSGGPSFATIGRVPVLTGIHTRVNYDTGVSKNLKDIMAAVGEPISLSTGLLGDVNGDFRVNPLDMYAILNNYGLRNEARYFQGDLSGDGHVSVTDLYLYSYALKLKSDLYAPADFDRNGRVDGTDLVTLGGNWLKQVVPKTAGDANGDGVVNLSDVQVFDGNQFRAYFGPLSPPLAKISGDLTGDGIVDGFDLGEVTTNLNTVVVPGTNGDADGNGVVNSFDIAYVSTRIGDSFGDINGDHEVGPLDFAVIAANWNKIIPGGRTAGDLNGDGLVTNIDAQVLWRWWGQQGGEFSGMSVPEPSSVLLFGVLLSLLGLSERSRRR